MLHLQDFTINEYQEYRSWYKDPSLAWALGDVDQEWLDYVLSAENQRELAFFEGTMLVGVIGVAMPIPEAPCHTITNFAVHPERRNQGLGTQMLAQLLPLYDNCWNCFIDERNAGAQRFFERHNWRKMGLEPERMLRYAYQKPA